GKAVLGDVVDDDVGELQRIEVAVRDGLGEAGAEGDARVARHAGYAHVDLARGGVAAAEAEEVDDVLARGEARQRGGEIVRVADRLAARRLRRPQQRFRGGHGTVADDVDRVDGRAGAAEP